MADNKSTAPAEAQKATPKVTSAKKFSRKAIMAKRMSAVQEAGNMTPKMQRGFDRFAANALKGDK